MPENERELILRLGDIVTSEKVKILKEYLANSIDIITGDSSPAGADEAYINGISSDKLCLWFKESVTLHPTQDLNKFEDRNDNAIYDLGLHYDEDGDLYFCSTSDDQVTIFSTIAKEVLSFVAKSIHWDKTYFEDFDDEEE